MKKTTILFLAIAGMMTTAPIVWAEDALKPPATSDRGMMGGDGQKMQGMMDMMRKMNQMMDNCDRMMDTKTNGESPKKG